MCLCLCAGVEEVLYSGQGKLNPKTIKSNVWVADTLPLLLYFSIQQLYYDVKCKPTRSKVTLSLYSFHASYRLIDYL